VLEQIITVRKKIVRNKKKKRRLREENLPGLHSLEKADWGKGRAKRLTGFPVERGIIHVAREKKRKRDKRGKAESAERTVKKGTGSTWGNGKVFNEGGGAYTERSGQGK